MLFPSSAQEWSLPESELEGGVNYVVMNFMHSPLYNNFRHVPHFFESNNVVLQARHYTVPYRPIQGIPLNKSVFSNVFYYNAYPVAPD